MALSPLADIGVLALEGTYLSSLGTFLDAYSLVARQVPRMFQPPYQFSMQTRVRLLAPSGQTVMLSGPRPLPADDSIESGERYRLIYVPAFEIIERPLLRKMLTESSGVLAWLRRQREQNALIAASGVAVFMLAEAGLLDAGTASVPKALTEEFRHRYPRVRLETRKAIAEHDGIFTTGLLAAETQLAARLVELTVSPHLARWLSNATGLHSIQDDKHPLSDDPLVASAQFWLGERFTQSFKISDLAHDLAVSHQTLIRRFERSLAMTPRDYVQMLRVDSGKRMLLNTKRSIDQIGAMVGYEDARSFRTVFREYTGMSPSEFRAAGQRAA